ncbi:MAG TPA: glycerophosphodiester phosphodiesterase family protein [Bacteroidota bacterium]|nr:glycerophosphodiester phosphodiesterase family protein [Bacteroidota bacterium]
MQPYQPKPAAGSPPYVIAHRGISGKAPENTVAAIRLAVETPGIDMIELDVRLSKEEEVIVLHDRTLQRTTTGNGRARTYTVEELKRFDAGSWFHPKFNAERIPTLLEVLQVVNKRRWINIEIKSDMFFREPRGLIERKVLDVVERSEYRSHVLISSFHHELLVTLRQMDTSIPLGVIYNIYRDFGKMPSKLAGQCNASVFVCAKHELTRSMLADARRHNIASYVYTLNSPKDVQKIMNLEVDGILSDNADDVVRQVKGPLVAF